jgi:DNA-binding CsgD family transcriptional regulator/tetratricopeptide (TPR) repeat protein
MRLLERESSLALLAVYAREARRGDGRLVLVAGEAGVGKSALVEQFQGDLPDARWSWGACDGLFTPRPLGPLFDLADGLGGELLELCRARAARDELFGALLKQISEPGTLDVVVVEDVHWADEATVDMLRFLGRRIANAAVLLIATYRDEDLTGTELLASGLLTGDGGWLRFRHEIARMAVQQAIAAHRRRSVHARILAALEAAGCDDDAQLAFHAEGAGDGPAALRYAAAAARRAAELASHREAAAQFERALRFAAGTAPATAAALCDGLAREAVLLDRWQDAVDAGERALELWRRAGNRLREGATLCQLSRPMWRSCRGREATAAAEAAVAILEPLGPSSELAWAYARLAGQRMLDGQSDAAIGLSRWAQALAESLHVPEVLSDALNTEGCAAADQGADWATSMHRALEIAVAEGLQAQAGRAYSNFHSILCGQRRFDEADRYFADGVAYCEEHDIRTYATCLRGARADALENLGRWEESVALSEEMLTRSGTSPVNRINPLISLGKIRARQGALSCWGYLDEAEAAADGTGEPQWIMPVRLARAEAYWLEGQPDRAAREAELADDVCASGDAWERGAVAAWLRRTGSPRPPRGDLAEPYRLQTAGDSEEAARVWTGLGCPYDAALALYDSPAEAAIREALTIFTDLGALAAAQITRQKMRLLGIRSIPAGPRSATRAHPLGLTRREREVLDLICAGHSNAQIAAKLFISTKTVDHHVSAVLAKLDAPTRNVAASHAVRLGLASPAET